MVILPTLFFVKILKFSCSTMYEGKLARHIFTTAKTVCFIFKSFTRVLGIVTQIFNN